MRLNKLVFAALAALAAGVAAPSALAQEHEAEKGGPAAGGHELLEPQGGWVHDGYFGTFDRNSLQRGLKVYREICSSCHGLKLMSFRNLGQPGGPFHDPAYPNPNDNPVVKAFAADYQIASIDQDDGSATTRAGIPADRFPDPYPNETWARGQNGGALPPDLSVITKARHGGAGYVYSLMQGFVAPPQGLTVAPGQYYNAYFGGDTSAQWAGDPRAKPPGGFLAMKPPLDNDGLVSFDDDTPSTKEQMARDVATFLAWAGDPKMETRKQMGVAVLAYLLILAALAYASYRYIWRNVEH
jgi:ubiquinol-cytochrome c reductase cytochrome c1 subunit